MGNQDSNRFAKAIPTLLLLCSGIALAETPAIPIGLDAYRMWDRWPSQRIGVRAYMRSTYDRREGNETADASHILYQLAPDRNIALDVEGPSVLYFVRYNHWHGSPWHINGVEISPATKDHGRTTTTRSELTLRIEPKNLGMLLRRKLDYSFPNQGSEVFIADAAASKPVWRSAGVWYLAGSNPCVYSYPPNRNELRASEHVLQTSNRRFRDDEFLIPRELTRGESAIRVRVQFKPVQIPLYPDGSPPALAWSEMRYTAYSDVTPAFPRPDARTAAGSKSRNGAD